MIRRGMEIKQSKPSRVGAAIKAARLRAGLRQEDVHAASGIATSSLSKIETGEARTPGYRILRAIAKAIGARPMRLAGLRSARPTCPVGVDEEYLLAAYRRVSASDRLLVMEIVHRMLHAPDGSVATFGWRGVRRCLRRGGNGNPARRISTGRGQRV